jgi:hypothetical protein
MSGPSEPGGGADRGPGDGGRSNVRIALLLAAVALGFYLIMFFVDPS